MSNKFRLSSGGEINRTERVSFKFNGKTFFGYKGDTLASALLANGVHLVGRSFKYHRPRGIRVLAPARNSQNDIPMSFIEK